jgi:Xaa-Pro aminopeptidase
LFRVADADGCFVGPGGHAVPTFAESVWSRAVRDRLEGWSPLTVDDPWPYWKLHDTGATVELFRRAATAVGFQGGRIAVADPTPARQIALLEAAFPGCTIEVGTALVSQLRSTKDAEETAQLAAGQHASATSLERVVKNIQAGVRAGELLDDIAAELAADGAEALCFSPDIYAVGPSISLTYSDDLKKIRNTELRAPCCLCLDVGGVYNGYCSDYARTVFVGEPEAGSLRAFEAAQAAQAAAVTAIKPGVAAADVDAAAREIVDEAGFGPGFWTAAGHGIGIQIHEPPALMHGIVTELAAGMVLSVEVGIWIDGKAGAFLEDLVVIEANGASWLSGPQRDPIVVS